MQQEKPLRKSQLHSVGYTFSSTPAISATITSFNSILFEIWICSFSYRRAVRICHFDDYSCRTMWYGLILCYLRVLWFRKDSVCHACLLFCLIFCVVHMGRREIGRGYNDLQRWWYTNYYSLIIMIKNVMLLIFNNIKKWFCCIVYSVLLLCCVVFLSILCSLEDYCSCNFALFFFLTYKKSYQNAHSTLSFNHVAYEICSLISSCCYIVISIHITVIHSLNGWRCGVTYAMAYVSARNLVGKQFQAIELRKRGSINKQH